jgi:predicted nucleic acid-binding protein
MVTTAVDRIRVDTNVLVYACLRNSPWHVHAIQALHTELQAGAEIWVSRQVLREYLAVLTRPGTTTLASPAATAMADVSAFQKMFFVADDTADVTTRLLALVQSVPMGGKQVHDANLVATMQVYGIPRLLTHNVADFTRFSAWITVVSIAPTP